MTVTTPRRAITCFSCPDGFVERYDLRGMFPGDPHDAAPAEALPRRPRPQRAVHCLTTNLCFGCPDDEHQRSGPAFEQQPRRAVHEGPWVVTEGWAS